MRTRLVPLLVLAVVLGLAGPASADHTAPRDPLVPLEPGYPAEPALTEGEGTWEFIVNFPAVPLEGGGTDHKFFRSGKQIYVSVGNLGQNEAGIAGQRIFLLEDEDGVNPQWVADHGSALCPPANTSVTGLQHDQAVLGTAAKSALKELDRVPARSLVVTPEVLLDTTDATGRCHDAGGGGIELVDITELEDPAFEPREIHLVRHAGTSHTVTVDETRPWIYYNSSSDFAGRPWIDVVDARSCLGLTGFPVEKKRAKCRPQVYRIPFAPDWARRRDIDGNLVEGTESACHDITSRGPRIYCAAPNATLIFDVRGITKGNGSLKGQALPCAVIPGSTTTRARVTDCGLVEGPAPENPLPSLKGWKFLGSFNHAGRICSPLPPTQTTCNSNTEVPPDEDISVAHQAEPTPDGKWMLVTDERGGGVIPPGASCVPGVDNPQGNGGIHVFDIRNPAKIKYAKTPDGEKAVFISPAQVPAPTFCDVHVIQHTPGEARLTVAYYTQGTKIVDYFIDNKGRWTFRETASIIFPNANTWSSDVFKIEENGDERTYWFVASDIYRGVDIFTWTGPTNPIGTPPPAPVSGAGGSGGFADLGFLALGFLGIQAAAIIRRRRL